MNSKEGLYIKRQQIKTSDGEFIHELLNSYELSIKLSEQILQSAKEILLKEGTLTEGQIEVTVRGYRVQKGIWTYRITRNTNTTNNTGSN